MNNMKNELQRRPEGLKVDTYLELLRAALKTYRIGKDQTRLKYCQLKLVWHEKIRKLGENETYRYLGILAADTINQVKMKDKIKKNISKEN